MKFAQICEIFRRSGIECPKNEAAILVRELFGDTCPSDDACYESETLVKAVEKRAEGYPLQYVIGKWWFARCTFEVNENCLIPRPDTEVLVEEAAKRIPEGTRFADLCTGSGCIAISLLDLREDISGTAVELFPKTLEIAKRNAKLNGVDGRIDFIEADVLEGNALGDEKYSAIISNPPYIRTNVIDTLSKEVLCEPRAALDGGKDGLIFYRAIVEKYTKNLCRGGEFLFEIGYDQAGDIEQIAKNNGFECRIVKDLGGNDRVAILKRLCEI